MPPDARLGWRWFESPLSAGGESRADAQPDREIARAFARCFATPEGESALRHLTDMTLRRALGPDAADALLRHLEGQRQLVAYIHALVARGRAGT